MFILSYSTYTYTYTYTYTLYLYLINFLKKIFKKFYGEIKIEPPY